MGARRGKKHPLCEASAPTGLLVRPCRWRPQRTEATLVPTPRTLGKGHDPRSCPGANPRASRLDPGHIASSGQIDLTSIRVGWANAGRIDGPGGHCSPVAARWSVCRGPSRPSPGYGRAWNPSPIPLVQPGTRPGAPDWPANRSGAAESVPGTRQGGAFSGSWAAPASGSVF